VFVQPEAIDEQNTPRFCKLHAISPPAYPGGILVAQALQECHSKPPWANSVANS
jgi:hypothetical protein